MTIFRVTSRIRGSLIITPRIIPGGQHAFYIVRSMGKTQPAQAFLRVISPPPILPAQLSPMLTEAEVVDSIHSGNARTVNPPRPAILSARDLRPERENQLDSAERGQGMSM